jgi:hypothetical protein
VEGAGRGDWVELGVFAEPAEGSPDVFYAISAGGPNYVLSYTPKGSSTQLASFPAGHNISPVISAPNQRFYGSVDYAVGKSIGAAGRN